MRLFALEGGRQLGARVAAEMGVALDPVEERAFADGEHKSRPMADVRGEDVYVLQGLEAWPGSSVNDRLVRLLFFIAACKEHGAAQVTAIVPYLAYSRKDRQTKARDPVTTRYMAQLFEAVGTDRVVTFDVHNVAAFQNAFRCQSVHLTARALFCAAMRELAGSLPVVVASPDAGGVKRAQLLKEAFEVAGGQSCGLALMEKRRSRGVVSGELFAGDVAGAAVFIVDDMIASGGTMLRAATACRERGAKAVYALATHGLFGEGSHALLESPLFEAIVVTDSVSLPLTLPPRVRVLPVGELIATAIGRLAANQPVSDLEGLEE